MFCFLREYEENTLPPAKKKRENEMTPSMSLELMVPASSNVAESSKMLTCCREFFSESPYILALRLENSVIQTTKDLYIVCQAPSHATVFKINIRDGKLACHNQNLKPYGVMDTFVCSDPDDLMEQPFPWHFTCDRKSIYAVPDKTNGIHVLSLDKGSVISLEATGPTGTDFSISLFLAVGSNIIAINDTLGGVYHLSDTHEWVPHSIQRSVHLEKKVELSGYAVLSDKSFMVCDGKTDCCFLFDLDKDTWSIVRAYSDISSSLPIVQPTEWSASRFLRGRSALAEGFIYTCADGGLRAYEIIKVQDSYCLSEGIFLKFPWLKYWGSDRMCLDYVGQDTASGAIMFCVVQGNNYDQHRLDAPDKHRVLITTIQIKTERTSRFTLKPVAVGHADGGTSFVGQDGGPIWTSSCFAP
ncbi:hypothetical protein PAHAL_4G054800 [Panicum hallii]|uniref:DUF1618 domain-containing protein n=1 Tax=Panicum hallii TaxID=206008 RepID=A0A2T8JBX4_9POAL|nr:uncharacterized protein LOC112889674 isoform X1 [Panicum hallii]PVH47408.1 hypothetical protein PAHAL_4G054800 [Panicum hallii]